MGTEGGGSGAAVIEQLLAEPYKFDFFQAVRLLERAGEGAPVGGDASPGEEAVRFRSKPSLSFAPSPVASIKTKEGGVAEMFVSFMGLTGPGGVLPHHYTSTLIREAHDKNPAMGEFLEMFGHRLVSLYYRAWEKYRVPAAYERAKGSDAVGGDAFTRVVLSLIGMGTGGLNGRSKVVDEALAHYGGLLATQPKTAVSLQAILCDFFEIQAEVEQFRGQWLRISEEDRTAFPDRRGRGGQNCELGKTTVLGSQVWDVSSKFRVRVEGLTFEKYCEFLPGGAALVGVFELTRLYVGPQLEFDVQLVLLAGEVPALKLGAGAQLGRTAWLKSRPFERDFSDAVFNLEAS